jgi:hypothetical protein
VQALQYDWVLAALHEKHTTKFSSKSPYETHFEFNDVDGREPVRVRWKTHFRR